MIGQQLCEFKQVAPRVCKKGHAKTHGDDVMRLRHDGDGPLFQLPDCDVDIVHAKADVMPPCRLVAVVKIRIGGAIWLRPDLPAFRK